jgi:hypothetical protein
LEAHRVDPRIVGAALVVCLGLTRSSGWAVRRIPSRRLGYVGYLTKGAVFGHSRFVGVQRGPTSPGRTWMLRVTNVSITPYTYTENFVGDEAVLSRDNLKIASGAHGLARRRHEIPLFMDRFSTTCRASDVNRSRRHREDGLRQLRARTAPHVRARRGAAPQRLDVKERSSRSAMPCSSASAVRARQSVRDRQRGRRQRAVSAEVADAVARKLAATQELQRKDTEIEIERKERTKREVQAQGIANAMQIIRGQLSAMYIQHEAIEAQKLMVGSPNHTVVYIPVGPMGVPLTGTMNATDPKGPIK